MARQQRVMTLVARGSLALVVFVACVACVQFSPLFVLQYILFVMAHAQEQLRLALSTTPVDTSWDGQASFVWKQIEKRPLASGVVELVVDIGAHDGIWQSNSHLFLQHGWRGLLVEPHPKTFQRLRRNIGARFASSATLVRAAAGLEKYSGAGRLITRGWLDGTENRVESVSGACSNAEMDIVLASTAYDGGSEAECVPILPMPKLLRRAGVPRRFALLSLDVEWGPGGVARALGGLLASGYLPEFLIVENAQSARSSLARAGYEHLLSVRYDDVFRLRATPADDLPHAGPK